MTDPKLGDAERVRTSERAILSKSDSELILARHRIRDLLHA